MSHQSTTSRNRRHRPWEGAGAGALFMIAALCVLADQTCADAPTPFAASVLNYNPAPGQFVNSSTFNDPARALGPPVGGGTLSPNLSSLVTLGGFGGSITLGFASPIVNLPPSPTNRLGLDVIVFGNAIYSAGNPNRRFAEAATVEVSFDTNDNGLADDAWYLIPGSHLPATPNAWPLVRSTQVWDADTDDTTYPPASPMFVPPSAPSPPQTFITNAFRLTTPFESALLLNPNGPDATHEGVYGYADCTPTLRLGDTNADNVIDDPSIIPTDFYTVPDDPLLVGISHGSGGGDAIDLAHAVDPATGLAVPLIAIHFVRITTAVNFLAGPLGEVSAEIDAVGRVVPPRVGDFNRDREVDLTDLLSFLDAWLSVLGGPALASPADMTLDDFVDLTDLLAFLQPWLSELGS